MSHEQMKQEIVSLIDEFNKHKHFLKQGLPTKKVAEHNELMTVFTSLKRLMESPLFFEVIFTEGYTAVDGVDKNGKSTKLWNFAIPILPLFAAFYRTINCPMYIESGHQIYFESVAAFEWTNGSLWIDTVLSSVVAKNCQNEIFLPKENPIILLRTPEGKTELVQIIQDLKSNSAPKITTMTLISNKVFTESLFFIKDEQGIEILVATSPSSDKASYIHSETHKLALQNSIKITPCTQIKVAHTGNCTVKSIGNINTVLFEAHLRNDSMYDTLDRLRTKQWSLEDHEVHLSDITATTKSTEKPDSPTLARLWSNIALLPRWMCSTGWFEFCKERSIHPMYAIKTPWQNWDKIYTDWKYSEKFERLLQHQEKYRLTVEKTKNQENFQETGSDVQPEPEIFPQQKESQKDLPGVETKSEQQESMPKPEVHSQQTKSLKNSTAYTEPSMTNPMPKPELSSFHPEFKQAIGVLKVKMKEFEDNKNYATNPKLQAAWLSARNLHGLLKGAGREFFEQNPSVESYDKFKAKCAEHMRKANEGVLSEHRGWGKILLNVFAMIMSLGIGYAVAAGINIAVKGRFTFFSTGSTEALFDIKDHINEYSAKAVPRPK